MKRFRLICTTMIGVLALSSGCSISNVAIDSNPDIKESKSTDVGTKGLLIPISSDNVRAAGYDANSLIMTVEFDNGAKYNYYGVPKEIWELFLAAQPHPWSQVGYPLLVKGGVPYKRIR